MNDGNNALIAQSEDRNDFRSFAEIKQEIHGFGEIKWKKILKVEEIYSKKINYEVDLLGETIERLKIGERKSYKNYSVLECICGIIRSIAWETLGISDKSDRVLQWMEYIWGDKKDPELVALTQVLGNSDLNDLWLAITKDEDLVMLIYNLEDNLKEELLDRYLDVEKEKLDAFRHKLKDAIRYVYSRKPRRGV